MGEKFKVLSITKSGDPTPAAFTDMSKRGEVGLKRFVCGLTLRVQPMGARTTSLLKDLKHRNACVGLAGNNLELAGNGKPELQATSNTL